MELNETNLQYIILNTSNIRNTMCVYFRAESTIILVEGGEISGET